MKDLERRNAAQVELGAFLFEWQQRHKLTATEYLFLLVEALRSDLNTHLKCEREEKERKGR